MPLHRLMLCVALLSAPAALEAQAAVDSTGASASVRAETADYGRRFGRMVLPAALGSGVGLVAGGLFGAGPVYSVTGCCGGGDDPAFTSAVMGGIVGATLGAALGAYATRTSNYPVASSRALVGATLGIGTGILVGLAGARVDPDEVRGLLVGFSIGQGGTAAAFAVPYP